jgi:CHAT domain-containing protein
VLEAVLELDSALTLYRASRAADPSYLPAQLDYFYWMLHANAFGDLRLELSRADERGGSLTICLTEITQLRRDDWEGAKRLTARLESGGSGCQLALAAPFLRMWLLHVPEFLPTNLVDSLPPLLHTWPECWRLHEQYAGLLRTAGRKREAVEALERGLAVTGAGLGKAELYSILRSWDDPHSPEGIAIEAAIFRDPRPGIPFSFGRPMPLEDRLRLYRSHRNGIAIWNTVNAEGKDAVERGEVTLGLRYLSRAVAIADSFARPGLQITSYMNRGRAFAKLGQLGAAEHDLLHAIALGPAAEDVYYVYESWHNLGHVYESGGRFLAAARAMDEFVHLTRDMPPGNDERWMSLHDAGTMRWKAGWHAAARKDFEAMILSIDQDSRATGHHGSEYFAGEYFERIGDFPRALDRYREGTLDRDPLSFAGLVRVYQQLGLEDSAEAAARIHDAERKDWPATESPLLPKVLATKGRLAEALPLARAWAERQVRGGHVHATALARLELADLLLQAGNSGDALTESTKADSLARSVNLTDELIRADELHGKALIATGRRQEGLAELRRTAALARAHPTADYVLTTQLALGDALSATGASDGALTAFDASARAVEQVTGLLDIDLDRAGYRDRHLLPFNGALRILIRRGNAPGNLGSLLAWSERRTGAALALATGVTLRAERPASLAQVQRRVSDREALLNYIVVDSTVAALVVTRNRAALVSLPLSVTSLQQLVDRIRRPLVATHGGQIDLAHATFDLAASHQLYVALIAPLESLLVGCHRIAIVPDGPLDYLPFEALVIHQPETSQRDYGKAEYLLDRFEIVYLPSAAFLTRASQGPSWRSGPTSRILVMENAVPGGAQEIAAIREAWPEGRITVLAETKATETAARAAAHGATVLHFAVHALADGRDPLASHLRLRADSANDGFFHANEIAAERFAARLVVLSGCETLVGPDYRGEGLMGLARAFLAGGAGAVLASHWPVGPSGADLMGGFYRGLSSGNDPATALRAAQLTLRHNPRTAHPFHWAGFVFVSAN